MTPFQTLLHRYAGTSHEKQLALEKLAQGEWSYDPDTGKLSFGERALRAQVLGSVDKAGQWLWAWANPDAYPEDVLRAAIQIQRRGVDLACDELCAAERSGDVDVGLLSLVACGIADGDGCFLGARDGAATLFLVKDPDLGWELPRADALVNSFKSLLEAHRLDDPKRALIEYWTQRRVSIGVEGDTVLGLTVDAQPLLASFNSQGRLLELDQPRELPANGFPLARLEWSGDDQAAKLVLGSIDASALGRLLASRALANKPFSLRGPRGRTLAVKPGPRAGFTVEEKAFGLFVDADATRGLLGTLRPACGEYELTREFPGLRIQVVESDVLDPDGKVVRQVGWDPLPTPAWALDPEEIATERARRDARRAGVRRLIKRSLLALVLLSPVLLVLFGSFYLRHVPYTIPEAYRPPPPGIGLALGTGLRLRYLGISGYELTDGKTTILLDPTLTRPTIPELISGPVDSNPELVTQVRKADYILVNHAHHDHAMDVPAIAKRTGAVVLGSQSVINLCLSRGVPPAQTRLAVVGERLRLGTFTVDVRTTSHSPIAGIPNPMSGLIPPDAGPLWFFGYTNDGMRFYRLEANGSSVWFHPSSTHTTGEFDAPPATTLIMGITGSDLTPGVVREVLGVTKPRWVIPTHYDNFFQPLSKGMALLPVIDLDASVKLFKDTDPELKVYVLDFEQAIELPGD